MISNYDLIVIGGGSAGLASAIEAYDNGIKKILIIEKDKYLGGILLQCIHNGFGLQEFKEELCGPEYAIRFVNEVKKRDIEVLTDTFVTKITSDKMVYYSNNKGYFISKAKAIICSTGCSERTRGAISIPGDRPSGVMTAGLAQKYTNIMGYMAGKKVFILGSGDIGLIMARRMTLEGAKVLGVAELMPYSNGLNRNIVQCLNDYNIPLYLSHTVKKIVGKDRLEKVVISKVDDKFNFIEETDIEFECDLLLLSVGLLPYNPLLKDIGVKLNPKTNGPIVNEYLETSIHGIFSCGNSLHVHDLVDYVTSEARIAGKNASKYIKDELNDNSEVITLMSGNNVGYVVPATSHINSLNDIYVKFRCKKPFDKCTINVLLNGKVIKSFKKLYLLPAEMENLSLRLNESEFDLIKKEEGSKTLSFEVVE